MKYLVAVDGSEHADAAFQYTLTLLDKENDELLLVSVIAPSRFGELLAAHKEGASVLSESEARIWSVVARYQSLALAANVKVNGEVVKGDVRTVLCQRAVEASVDVVVVGARGLSTIKRLVLGSVSSYVLSHCHASVLVVKHGPRAQPARTFLFGHDASPGSDHALALLLKIAQSGDTVILAHAFQNLQLLMDQALAHSQGTYTTVVADVISAQSAAFQKSLEADVQKCLDKGLHANGHFSQGDPREVLGEIAREQYVDMTVVGCRSLSAVQWWYVGSVSHDVAHNVDCGAVLVVKHALEE